MSRIPHVRGNNKVWLYAKRSLAEAPRAPILACSPHDHPILPLRYPKAFRSTRAHVKLVTTAYMSPPHDSFLDNFYSRTNPCNLSITRPRWSSLSSFLKRSTSRSSCFARDSVARRRARAVRRSLPHSWNLGTFLGLFSLPGPTLQRLLMPKDFTGPNRFPHVRI